ncbi:putative amidophosphoribosyltransferase [Clostridium pasteurianum DSM 525 = ATCC 6013]|uniref:Phosphoribosyltransferase n=1 Tax=Clostridium pasteurianum DSM 525 = ATCC 6013 TaxID=1262449 RepID=A0A0H3JAJ4_CLOPA|nr:phosphoribosyltransferase family protein [Clostridium pasteurianum]AJA49603.1 putative amidophosphoribosyltransferase [Clostridium pasteurianum DSM 525 = ATCC 6013]AJA53591.1 putative amidophosphoribosyltransferase [Clostridium pasteurianum DSM 525 = ATCC 6013]AOZ76757.1 competence protein ComF [Clostridium pasteurianum DSM 525 = ATCC 6013]AOZ80554.1 competence protein ComF [Clostridium pasteurianum]ELP58881.1 ComF protein-like protein [Clostridium pasteurianum DSM 525 = ATCC 6013]
MGRWIIEFIKYLLDCVLSVLYCREYKCIECGNYVEESSICNECSKKIKFCKEFIRIKKNNNEVICYSVSYYSNLMVKLILRLKYKSDFVCADIISSFMIKVIQENHIKFDSITFIPMTRKALRKRGYNQSRILAKIISDKLNVELIDCLKKVRETKDQIGLDGNSRWENLFLSFKIKNSNKILGKNILIIDDVITTGATSYYCAEELLNNGAKKVKVLTAAKTSI